MVLNGVVREEDGRPVPGARVYIVGGPAPTPDIALVTGPDGRFALGVTAPGRYTVEASAEGRTPARATVEAGGEPVDFELRFPRP